MSEPEGQGPQPGHGQLGLWDAVSIIIGIVIGTSIFYTPSIINGHLGSPGAVLGVWTLGGVLCLVGALCYAELASAYPRMGGDYVYLTRAFGPFCGFMFGWAQLAVIFTASIGMMAFVFGDYAIKVFEKRLEITPETQPMWQVTMAFAAVVTLAVINILGVVMGKTTQNILSLTKVLGLGGIAVAGLLYGQPSGAWVEHAPTEGANASFGVALILVLYAYGGWNDAAFVAADMRERRHIPATLLLGTAGVMVIYLIVNVAYIQALGFEKTQGFNPTPIAARTLGQVGEWASLAISVLVMISALGAINGLLFAGSRVSAALGKEHSVFAVLGRFNHRLGSPVFAFLALALISMSMILVVGTKTGRDTIDQALAVINIAAIPWDRYFGGFETLFAGTAAIFWTFFLLTGISIFILRVKDKDVERPFKIPGYPVTPLIFCGMCLFGLYSAVTYAKLVALIGLAPLLLGVPLYLVSRYRPTQESEPLHRIGAAGEPLAAEPSTAIQEAPSSAIKESQP